MRGLLDSICARTHRFVGLVVMEAGYLGNTEVIRIGPSANKNSDHRRDHVFFDLLRASSRTQDFVRTGPVEDTVNESRAVEQPELKIPLWHDPDATQ